MSGTVAAIHRMVRGVKSMNGTVLYRIHMLTGRKMMLVIKDGMYFLITMLWPM